MNCAQAIRLALLNAHMVAINQTTSAQFTQAELLSWANDAKDKIEKRLRTVHQDYNLVFRSSTDASFRWDGFTYAPSNFQLVSGTQSYTLPPDVLEVRRIRAITAGEEARGFRHEDLSSPEFVSKERLDALADNTTGGELLWDIVGERTLRLAQSPETTLDIEIAYIPRSRRLQVYTTGTVTPTQDSATIPGASTLWVDDEVNPFADILISTTTGAPQIVTQTAGLVYVDPSRTYNPIASIESDTSLTLHGAWLTATLAAGRGYMIASRFPFPVEFAHLAADWVSYRILKKARSADQTSFKESFDDGLQELAPDTAERQTADPEFAEDHLFD